MDLTLTTPSTALPVTMDEAKDHLYVTDDRYIGAIRSKVRGAVDYCQRQVSGHRQIMSATWTGKLRRFPGNNGRIEFPFPPLQSNGLVVGYTNTTGSSATLSSTAYDVVTNSETPGFIEPAFGETWPTVRNQAVGVTLTFVAGWPDTKDVPDTIKQAVLLKLEHLWDPGRVKESEMKEAVHDLMSGNEYEHYA